MKLDQFATMRGFELAHTHSGQAILDHVITSPDVELKLRRVQFDTSPQLADEIERVCSLLGCSKRHFLEMAVAEALDRAETRFQEAFAEAAGRDISEVFAS